MSDFETDPEDCGHDDLEYHDMDVSEPQVVYENWGCQDCGATVVKVYEPSHELVFLPGKDEPITREIGGEKVE
jgi:hypothetical protein